MSHLNMSGRVTHETSTCPVYPAMPPIEHDIYIYMETTCVPDVLVLPIKQHVWQRVCVFLAVSVWRPST